MAPPAPLADVPGLQAFVAVARRGTVVRAARELGRTQPSISARLTGLERAWGTRLFRRVARGMLLTPEGARLLPLAEATLRDLERLDREAGVPLAPADELRIGAGDALGRERLPRALRALLREHPALDVRILEGPRVRLLDALRQGEIDVALVVGPVPAEEGLDVAPLLDSPIDLLVPAEGSRRRPPAVPLKRLAGMRLVVLQPDSGFRRHLEAAFAEHGIPFAAAVEVGNLSLIRRFVAAGLGVAPVPGVAFGEHEAGRGVERQRLTGIGTLRYLRVLRGRVPQPPATRRLLELLA